MSSINNYRDTSVEDYLTAGERERKSKKAGNTAQNNTAISGLLPATSSVTVTTLAEIGDGTKEATTAVNVTTLAVRDSDTTFNFTNAAEDTGNLRWSFGQLTNSTGGFS